MDELIVEPAAQQTIIDLLTDELAARSDPARVSNKILNGRCIRVTLSGGDDVTSMVLVTPWLTLEAFDATATAADELMRLCVALIRRAAHSTRPDGTQIYDVGTLGPGAAGYDTDGKRPKYTRVVTVGMRATAV